MSPDHRNPPSPELLLEQAGWIRNLAIQLVGDAHRADDLAQETWVRMLRNPPSGDRPIRGWIATVMRNLLWREYRSDEARRAREQRNAEEDRDDTDQLLDRVTSHREVAAAVLKARRAVSHHDFACATSRS